jgi:hypothetical protein
MTVAECTADDARLARVTGDVEDSYRSRVRWRRIAGLGRSARRRIAIGGHPFSEVAERPLLQELLERHI